MNFPDVSEEAIKLLEEANAFRTGHFVLKSGAHAHMYVEKALVTVDPLVTKKLSRLMVEPFKDFGVEVVVGPTVGAVPFTQYAAEILRELTGIPVLALYAEEDSDKNRVLKRSGYADLARKKKVLVIEDIITTSTSAKKTIIGVQEAGGIVVAACVIVNRRPAENTAESLDVPALYCLISKDFPHWEPTNCPYCKDGIEINNDSGHGAEYIAKYGQPGQ